MTQIFPLPLRNFRILRSKIRIGTGPNEHAHVGDAGNALGIAHMRSALDAKSLAHGDLRVALVAVDENGRNGSRLVELGAPVGVGLFRRDHVDALSTHGNGSATREHQRGGKNRDELFHVMSRRKCTKAPSD